MTKTDQEREAAALAALAAGDPGRALTILMDAYGDAMYRFCRAAVIDAALAEDILQNVFVDAHDGLTRFAGRSTLLAWLFGIARHRCLDAVKARRRWRARFSFMAADRADPTPAAEEALAAQAREAILLGCLEKLAPEVRLAVLMRCQEGLSYEEMARMSRERAGTLQARVSRALPVLRACVEKTEGGRERTA